MTPLEALGTDAARALDGALDPARLARQRESFLRAAAAPPRAPLVRARPALVLAALAAAVLLASVVRRPRAPALLTARAGEATIAPGQWIAAPERGPLALRFSDGTRIELAPGTQARLMEATAHGARVLLERGGAEVRVVRRPGAAWRLVAGPYTVDVTGTRFTLAWEPSLGELDLVMHAGRVLVRGPRCGEGLAVAGHEEIHARLRASTLTLGPLRAGHVVAQAPAAALTGPVRETVTGNVTAPPRPVAPVARARVIPPGPREVPVAPRPEERAWVQLARAGRHREALAALDAPGFAAVLDGGTADELLLLADAARLGGDVARARDALLALRRRHALHASAPGAAYLLGVISLEAQHAPAAAARWFELYLDEAPEGALAAEARGRRVQALAAAGDQEGARRAAERCLAMDPGGAFAGYARSVLAR